MKFVSNTASKPVVGKEAKVLAKALRSKSYVASAQALNTFNSILRNRGLQEIKK